MNLRNREVIESRVGDQNDVCGLWKCQACGLGMIYYEVREDGSRCSCTNHLCEDHDPTPIREWSRANNPDFYSQGGGI